MKTQDNKFIITKLDAARRQIDIALRLFFSYEDVVSVHTLACAAEEIISRVSVARGNKTLRQEVIDMVIPEKRKYFIGVINKAQNFFKHSNTGDHAESLNFKPATTEIVLISACTGYKQITGEYSPYMKLFNMWYFLNYPNILSDQTALQKAREIAQAMNVSDRQQYLDLLPLITKL